MPRPDHAIRHPGESRDGAEALAPAIATWQGRAMSEPRPNAAGGALIALGMIGGAAIGFAVGQATPGFLIGTAVGVGVAIIVWLRDRR